MKISRAPGKDLRIEVIFAIPHSPARFCETYRIRDTISAGMAGAAASHRETKKKRKTDETAKNERIKNQNEKIQQ
jgi:hypothetical protein